MYQRILALMMAAVLAVSMAACGAAPEEPPKGVITPNQETQQQEPTGDQTQQEPTGDQTEPEQTEAEDSDSFSLGTMQGGTYENAYTGFGCKLDENWIYKTAEELQDISGMTQEMFEGTDLDINAYTQILDMMAECPDPMASINIQYTLLNTQERLSFAVMGEEGVIDATLQQKDALISTYAQAGIDVADMEKVSVNFCGEERYAIYTTASVQGVGYYLLQLFETNLGPYYVTVTLGTFGEDNTAQLLDLFYSLD